MRRFLLLTALLVGCASSPTAVQLQSGNSQRDVGKAVRLALAGRQWAITAESDGFVEAAQEHGATFARVRIDYDANSATIKLLESKYLDPSRPASQGELWVENLARDIPTHLRRVSIIDGD